MTRQKDELAEAVEAVEAAQQVSRQRGLRLNVVCAGSAFTDAVFRAAAKTEHVIVAADGGGITLTSEDHTERVEYGYGEGSALYEAVRLAEVADAYGDHPIHIRHAYGQPSTVFTSPDITLVHLLHPAVWYDMEEWLGED